MTLSACIWEIEYAQTQKVELFAIVTLAAALSISASNVALADGDVVAGEGVFQRCLSCHVVAEASNQTGPTLLGVVGRPVASVKGFAYSDALRAFGATGAVWDEATLDKFLRDPMGFIKGIKMVAAPVRRDTERADLIEFLKSKK